MWTIVTTEEEQLHTEETIKRQVVYAGELIQGRRYQCSAECAFNKQWCIITGIGIRDMARSVGENDIEFFELLFSNLTNYLSIVF